MTNSHLFRHRMPDTLPTKSEMFCARVASLPRGPKLPKRACSLCGVRASWFRVPVPADADSEIRRICARAVVPAAEWPAFAREVGTQLRIDPSLVHPGASCGPPVASFITRHVGYTPTIVNVVPPAVWVTEALSDRLASLGVERRSLEAVQWVAREGEHDALPAGLPRYVEVTPFSSVVGQPAQSNCGECGRMLPDSPDAVSIQRASWNGDPCVALDGHPGQLVVSGEIAAVMKEAAPREVAFDALPME